MSVGPRPLPLPRVEPSAAFTAELAAVAKNHAPLSAPRGASEKPKKAPRGRALGLALGIGAALLVLPFALLPSVEQGAGDSSAGGQAESSSAGGVGSDSNYSSTPNPVQPPAKDLARPRSEFRACAGELPDLGAYLACSIHEILQWTP